MKKVYYRIKFNTESALSLGSGENNNTDKDILKDSRGIPYIPGTSLAGIYRNICGISDEEELKKYFGNVVIATESNQETEATESRIAVYDATICGDNYRVSKRDCVGLDEYKTAKKGAKFDFEILEPGACFVTYIEQTIEDKDDNIAEVLAGLWQEGISIGAKTMRGLGRVKATEIKQACFEWQRTDSCNAEDDKSGNAVYDLDEWLGFDMFNDADACWGEFSCRNSFKSDVIVLNLKLKQRSGISIRQYMTEPSTDEQTQPDYKQLVYKIPSVVIPSTCETKEKGKENNEERLECAVIPGTSWTGAISHQMRKLGAGDIEMKHLFGSHEEYGNYDKVDDLNKNNPLNCKYTSKENKKYVFLPHKSNIEISESVIVIGAQPGNGKYKTISRNAIDRFTGGTSAGALYTEKYVYGGETELTITIPKSTDEKMKNIFAAAIADLHHGFMAVGGLTAIGRGLFEVVEINGVPVLESEESGEVVDINGKNLSKSEEQEDIVGINGEKVLESEDGVTVNGEKVSKPKEPGDKVYNLIKSFLNPDGGENND